MSQYFIFPGDWDQKQKYLTTFPNPFTNKASPFLFVNVSFLWEKFVLFQFFYWLFCFPFWLYMFRFNLIFVSFGTLFFIYKIPKQIATRSFWTLPTPDSFNLYFILFYVANFLSLSLSTYTERGSMKCCTKPKNFTIVDSEILSMKNEMSRVSRCLTLAQALALSALLFSQ